MDPKGRNEEEEDADVPAPSSRDGSPDAAKAAHEGSVIAPQILQYLDYRDFLRDYYAHRKVVDGDFSQRNFAREAGLPASCSSLLPAVIKGRRQLSQNLRIKFGKAMRLGEREYRYFDLLVQFNQAKGMTEKNFFFGQLT